MSDEKDPREAADRQALVGRYKELAELAGSLAHEIKNPLSVIRMNMDLLAEDLGNAKAPVSQRVLSKVEVVQNQCTRLENLLNDFLKFTRLQELDLVAGNLNDQVNRVLDLFTPQANEAEVEIVRYLDPDLPSVQLNSQTIQAALINLVKNALEAMPDGGQLIARTRETRTGVALDLIDTGSGMDEQTAMKMFDAFFTTKDDGSGLGLPTARRIIEAHGGWIGVQSEMGQGTQFTLEFPLPARIASSS